MMTNEEFDEYVNELIDQKGGIEKAIEYCLKQIARLNEDFLFINGENLDGESVEFFVDVLDELHYRIGMN
jgi:hypothetical protein